MPSSGALSGLLDLSAHRGRGDGVRDVDRVAWLERRCIAAVVCQMARDAGGPEIAGQLLVTPVVDCDFSRRSYIDNADGYLLAAALMHWFWDHYPTRPIGKIRRRRRAALMIWPISLRRSW